MMKSMLRRFAITAAATPALVFAAQGMASADALHAHELGVVGPEYAVNQTIVSYGNAEDGVAFYFQSTEWATSESAGFHNDFNAIY
ncbi:hypothetical protein CLV72_106329 [Allonocardiopsis opalescens]|uniref:Uncharacterized protein n=2 Tax=Allonocardiopsis opalescens TaxID=1144618 RepID=A0A2T0Q0G7_9ACTN|nr:hypothetical protein CLV72_106329 [Allonocardiopsis opalescens]